MWDIESRSLSAQSLIHCITKLHLPHRLVLDYTFHTHAKNIVSNSTMSFMNSENTAANEFEREDVMGEERHVNIEGEECHEAATLRPTTPANEFFDSADAQMEGEYDAAAQEETRSHFSDSSSDEEDWSPEEALKEFRLATETMKSPTDSQRSSVPSKPIATTQILPASTYNRTPTPPPPARTPEQQLQDRAARYQPSNRPYLGNAFVRGSLLPVGGLGDDDGDLYNRDVQFFHTGRPDTSRSSSPAKSANSHGYPSLLTDEGVIKRVRAQRDQIREQLNETEYKLTEAENEKQSMGKTMNHRIRQLEEADQEIGMLKHAVTTFEERIEKLKESANAWKQRSEKWQQAFENQEPLADAERERRLMKEAGIEASKEYVAMPCVCFESLADRPNSADTQTEEKEDTSPGPQAEQSDPTTTEAQPKDQATQTDDDTVDLGAYIDLASQRDDLIKERDELSMQAHRLKYMLEETNQFIEGHHLIPKRGNEEATDKNQDSNETGAKVEGQASRFPTTPTFHRTPKSAKTRPSALPTPLPGQPRADVPEKWVEREQQMNKTSAWTGAKDAAAAALDEWERQMFGDAMAGAD